MANIYDIAKASGVSRSTVSRVINNQPSVSPQKREKVLEAIQRLQYTPSATARALATNKTNTIGIVARELAQNFYGEFINHIHYQADERNYGVLYTMRNNFLHTNIDYRSLLHKKVDGYLFLGQGTATKDEIISLIHNNIPVIGYEFEYSIADGLFININNKMSAYEATKYLYDLGHRRMIHLTFTTVLQEMEARKEGFLKGMKDLEFEDFFVEEVEFTQELIFEKCLRLIPIIKSKRMTAAFCCNNTVATALIEALMISGISVPRDFSVIGFDDTPVERSIHIKRNLIPEITSIKQPQKEMANYGVQTLIQQINEGIVQKGYKNKVFDCKIILRDSTGPL